MGTYFSSKFFRHNRERLRKLSKTDAPIVIVANGRMQRNSDNVYPFSQDSSFWYLTGINEPDVMLVLDGDKEYLILSDRSDTRAVFDGHVDTLKLTKRSGIETVLPEKNGWQHLARCLKKSNYVATLPALPTYVDRYGFYTNPARAVFTARLKSYSSNLKIQDISSQLIAMRMVKQPEEIATIQLAIDITASSIKSVTKEAKHGRFGHEYEIEAALTKEFRRRGASGHGFVPIVAGGQRALTLHEVSNDGDITPGMLVVIDVGAEVEHYSADLTRTVAIGSISSRQEAILMAVQTVQKETFGLLKPGVYLHDYEQQVEQLMGEQLRRLGLIKKITHKDVRYYYPHATSHFLGLDVHDVGDYNRPLEEGMVMTVEPGIYIPEESIGVRIEDDVLITHSGVKVLSSKLP
jgi:Xaa-Pro aminopeptidase